MYRKFMVAGVILLCSLSNVFALSFLGSPTAELDKSQTRIGYNYSQSMQDLEKTKQDWYVIDTGVVTGSGQGQLRIEDLNIQRHYAGINYGLGDQWEVFVRLGLTEVKGDIHWLVVDSTSGYNFDSDFTWGWGTKVTLLEDDKIDWGASFQMNWLDINANKTGTDAINGPWKEDFELDAYDMLFAFGPKIDMGGWELYGGPFYYYFSSDYDWQRNYYTINSIDKECADLEAGSNFGGFLGAQCNLSESSTMTVELSATGDGWGVGAGATFKY